MNSIRRGTFHVLVRLCIRIPTLSLVSMQTRVASPLRGPGLAPDQSGEYSTSDSQL